MSDQPDIDPTKFQDPLSDFEPIQYASELERALAEEAVDRIQILPFSKILPTATVREAVHLLQKTQVASVLVVDNDDKLVGLFTERDALERVAENFARVASQPVSEFMTTNPTVVYESDPSATALAAIAVEGHRHIPVLGMDGRVIGIASPRRVFDFIEEHDQ